MSIIKRQSVRLDAIRPASGAGAAPGQACTAAPHTSARLLRANGVVRAIEVTCACGEVTVLELEVEATREGAKEP
jgi:hypothetical protein